MIHRDGEWAFAQNWVEQTRKDMEDANVYSLSYYCNMSEGMVKQVLDYLRYRQYHDHMYLYRMREMDKYLTR